MPDIAAAATRKIGPLPAWAWGGVVGGSILAVKLLTGDKGASSPFVQPLAQDGAIDFEPSLGGGSGGGSGTTTPPATTTPATGARWGSDIPAAVRAVIPAQLVADKLKALGVSWGTAINWGDIRAGLKARGIDPTKAGVAQKGTTTNLTSIRTLLKPGTGKTTYQATGDTDGAQGDTTPGTAIASVPFGTPLPIGNILSLPVFDSVSRYSGPTVSEAPIASAARIALPPISGGRRVMPDLAATPEFFAGERRRGLYSIVDPPLASARRIFDRLTPDLPPTTARPRLRIADTIRTRYETRRRRNDSG